MNQETLFFVIAKKEGNKRQINRHGARLLKLFAPNIVL